MDIYKLEAFVVLAETLNYTETAERQFTTQGNISKQILSLEKEFMVELFERSHRKITLTQAGELALPYAKELVATYHALKNTMTDFQTAESLSFTLQTIPTMPNYHGFSQITDFLKLHPEIMIHLQESESHELIPSLIEERVNIIFARTFEPLQKGLEQIVTEQDQFVAVLPKSHPLASKQEIALAELQHDHFLILGKETNLFEPVLNLCHESGFHPKITYEGSRIDLITKMISSDLGIAVVMEKTINNLLTAPVVVIPIEPNKLSQLSFIRKKGTSSKASDLFWQYLQNIYL